MLGMVKKRRPALTIPLVILAVIGVLLAAKERASAHSFTYPFVWDTNATPLVQDLSTGYW